MTTHLEPDFERLPNDGPLDETAINLRAYFAQMTEQQLTAYDPTWPDERIIEWDGNFRNDGVLMLPCCERDVDIQEYREVLELHLNYRRSLSTGSTGS